MNRCGCVPVKLCLQNRIWPMGSFSLTPGGDFTNPLLEVRLGVLFLFARLLFRILFKINTLEIEVLAESHGPQD